MTFINVSAVFACMSAYKCQRLFSGQSDSEKIPENQLIVSSEILLKTCCMHVCLYQTKNV